MYASPSSGERAATGLGSVAVVALVGYVLVTGLNVPIRILAEHPLPVLDLRVPPPPPPQREAPPPPERHHKAERVREEASPANLRAKATPVVAPLPSLVPAPPVIAALKPNIGVAPSNGASDRPGSGQGAGGVGNGTGGGGQGDEDDDTPPRRIKGRLGFSDMPGPLRAEGVERTVAVRYVVDVDGRVSSCSVTGSSGDAGLDRITCELIEKRFRFEPSRDPDGRPVRSIVVEQHSWRTDRAEDGA